MAGEQRSVTYDFSGRVVLVPGGSGGIGQAVTRAFAASGASVVIAGNSEHPDQMGELQAELGDTGERVSFSKADLLDEAAVERTVWTVVERHHRLDMLVNLVGGWSAGQPVTGLELATWRSMLDVNLNAAFLVSKYAARPMTQ
jgi:NAD(P)-dependent dehydrogenase (short-subunit alcohol dehydrogenase family)